MNDENFNPYTSSNRGFFAQPHWTSNFYTVTPPDLHRRMDVTIDDSTR